MTNVADALAGIPALPVAVAKVLEETGRDDPDAKVISRAIETDAGLAAKMLSLVNSPYYGLNGAVTSLNQAVMIVGMRQVRNVALAVGAMRSIPGIPSSVTDVFLDRAMVCAKTARGIAGKGGLSAVEADTAHVGGLLRNVGFLVSLRMGKTRPTEGEIVSLSRMLLEYWKLPPPIVAAVADSVGPFKPEEPARAAHAVQIATVVVEGRPAKADPAAMASLGLKPVNLEFFAPPAK